MDNFPFPQEADNVTYIWIVGQAQDIIISEAGFLLCCHILSQIGNNISSDLHGRGRPGITGGELRIYAGGMVHKIGVKTGGSDLLLTQVTGELVDQSSNHFQVTQFFCTYQGGKKYQQKIA